MIKLPRRISRAFGASLTELGINSLTWAAAGLGGCVGFGVLPGSWPTYGRGAAAGVLTMVFAVGTEDLLEDVVAPLRGLFTPRPGGARRPADPVAAPASVQEGVARVRHVVCANAATRAADDAFQLDYGQVLFTDSSRWQGYPDGTATFLLAPGAYLRYWRDSKGDGRTPKVVFTFVTAASPDPVRVTDTRQLQRLVEQLARPAGEEGGPGPKGAGLQTA